MDSIDNLCERFEALEQRTEHWHQHTRTVVQRLRWGGISPAGWGSWAW